MSQNKFVAKETVGNVTRLIGLEGTREIQLPVSHFPQKKQTNSTSLSYEIPASHSHDSWQDLSDTIEIQLKALEDMGSRLKYLNDDIQRHLPKK